MSCCFGLQVVKMRKEKNRVKKNAKDEWNAKINIQKKEREGRPEFFVLESDCVKKNEKET